MAIISPDLIKCQKMAGPKGKSLREDQQQEGK